MLLQLVHALLLNVTTLGGGSARDRAEWHPGQHRVRHAEDDGCLGGDHGQPVRLRWGSHDLLPQAGLGVYERGPDGLLAAARVYDDDVEPPAGHP